MRRQRTHTIVVHTAATRPGLDIGAAEIDAMHRNRRPIPFREIGYHAVIRLGGAIEPGRALDDVGAHVSRHNAHSLGVCLIGGLDAAGRAAMTYDEKQLRSLRWLIDLWRAKYPDVALVTGHRDLSPDLDGDGEIERFEWVKDCPCLDVDVWYETGEARFSA